MRNCGLVRPARGRLSARSGSVRIPYFFEREPEIFNSVTFSKGLRAGVQSDSAKILLFRRFWRQMVRILHFCKEKYEESEPSQKLILASLEAPSHFVDLWWPRFGLGTVARELCIQVCSQAVGRAPVVP